MNTKCVISPPFGHYIKFLPWATPIRGTFTVIKRPGIIKNAVKTFRPAFDKKGWVNKMGLVNKGLMNMQPLNPNHIWSITAFSELDWFSIASMIPSDVPLEANVSCVNSNEIFINNKILQMLSSKFNWVSLKLPSNSISEAIDVYQLGRINGIKVFHAGNTIKTPNGGLSGQEIKKVSLPVINKIRGEFPEAIIIGGGGIYSAKDVYDYKEAGADIFSLSTICMTPWKIPSVYKAIYKK